MVDFEYGAQRLLRLNKISAAIKGIHNTGISSLFYSKRVKRKKTKHGAQMSIKIIRLIIKKKKKYHCFKAILLQTV